MFTGTFTDMAEIASIIKLILANTKASIGKENKVSKAKYIIDESAKNQAKERVTALLQKYILYPELDLDFLLNNF